MDDFICEIQADELIHGDDFLQWVAFMEERDEDDLDRHVGRDQRFHLRRVEPNRLVGSRETVLTPQE